MVPRCLGLVALLAAAPWRGQAAALSGGDAGATGRQEVQIVTAICGLDAAREAIPTVRSLLFHRSSAVRLHILADAAAIQALRVAWPTTAAAARVTTRDARTRFSANAACHFQSSSR